MIFNGGLVRFWRAPPGRMDLIWTWPEEGCFTPRGVPTWRGLAPVAVGGFKREGSLQAGSGGGAEEGGRAGPTPAFVYCFARGRRRGTSADVTPGAPLATNLHRTTRLLRSTDLPLPRTIFSPSFPPSNKTSQFSTVGSRTCPPGNRSFLETSPFLPISTRASTCK